MRDEEQSGDGQDPGVTPQRKGVKCSNMIILVVCGCMVAAVTWIQAGTNLSDKC